MRRWILGAAAVLMTAAGCGGGSSEVDSDAERASMEAEQREQDALDDAYEAEQELMRQQSDARDRVLDLVEQWARGDYEDDQRGVDCRTQPLFVSCGDVIYVTKVVDGDTLRLENGDLVRLVGVDAPEVYPKVECFGTEVRERVTQLMFGDRDDEDNPLVSLLEPGSVEALARAVPGHPDRDAYGRLLRRVSIVGLVPDEKNPYWVAEIEDLGRWLLSEGLATFDDFAEKHYGPAGDVAEALKGYRRTEDRTKGGWVECGW